MAIKLTTGNRIAETSSKGNQEKWQENGRWFKLDMFGYEGLAETVTSALLARTNITELGFRYVTYCMERLEVHGRTRNGCSSADFLQSGESILTLADLLRSKSASVRMDSPDCKKSALEQPLRVRPWTSSRSIQ